MLKKRFKKAYAKKKIHRSLSVEKALFRACIFSLPIEKIPRAKFVFEDGKTCYSLPASTMIEVRDVKAGKTYYTIKYENDFNRTTKPDKKYFSFTYLCILDGYNKSTYLLKKSRYKMS